MKNIIILAGFMLAFVAGQAQTKVGDRWVDNNLTIRVTKDLIKSKGEFVYCVADTSRGPCIQNLQTGITVKVYNSKQELIWEGIASGRLKGLKLPRPMPEATHLEITAFKPYVINKTTGNYIHQDEAIHVKYEVQ